MKLEIIKYNESLKKSWDDFVHTSINGSFLHSRAFFDHNPLNKQDDYSFLYYKKNKVIGLLPFILYTKDGNKILHSHLRSTYGGFVINKEVGLKDAIEMVGTLREEAEQIDINEIIICNSFRIFHTELCDEMDYAMWYHGFQIKSRQLEIAVKLNSQESVPSLYDESTKRNIKKGNKSLLVEEGSEYETYWKILTENLESKHGSRPTHSLEQIKILLDYLGKDKMKLFLAKLNGKIIAGILVFVVNETGLHAQYIASDQNFQNHRPLDVIIDYIINWGVANDYQYFNLGTANEDNGKIINYGLFRFKEGFGGRGTLRETMHLLINQKKSG